jgi:hypothetical protein
MRRRSLLSRIAILPALAGLSAEARAEPKTQLKIMFKSAWGSDDPTKAAFPFFHANAVVPVGWPPLAEALGKAAAAKIPIYACGACSRARGVTDQDLTQWGAKFGNPAIFVSLVEWADHVITE